MPALSKITNTFFTNLINRLGVRPPPESAFFLDNVVKMVSLVDSDIALQAVLTTSVLDVPATQGEVASPVGAGALLADTGALPAGNYSIVIMVGSEGSAAAVYDFRVQRRDAANAANVWSQQFMANVVGVDSYQFQFTARLLVNERIRVITKNAATVGISVQANIWSQLVA
jgi:hypothetical protein